MAAPFTDEQLEETRGIAERHRRPDGSVNSTSMAAEMGLTRSAVQNRLKRVEEPKRGSQTEPEPDFAKQKAAVFTALRGGRKTAGEIAHKVGLRHGATLDIIDDLRKEGYLVEQIGESFQIAKDIRPAIHAGEPMLEIVSRPDNTFLFGASGDLHAASKYCRWDVRNDLYDRFERAGVQCSFDTGNWVDGEKSFNRHDLEAHGLGSQVRLLAERHPKKSFATYAVAGDDHEGWYAQSEGIDVGRYAQGVMQDAGHDWHDLGYMEAHVRLVNANTGKSATLAVVHPGGGSAYALSYSIQKIVESYEGGEKPHVGLYGHYHKLWAGLIRNVWVVQTGTCEDQTPFMRKKRLEAHVGGTLVKLEQDPESGAIFSMTPQLIRYFNKGWYDGRWSHSGPVQHVPRAPGFISA